MNEKFSISNLRSNREFVSYIQIMISHAKNASFDSQFH